MQIRVDLLNIGLIIISAVLAYYFPLGLFVLAYSILGPLHYLTEINWLNDKKYFTNYSAWVWLGIGLSAVLALVVPKIIIEYAAEGALRQTMLSFNQWSNSILFMSLLLAIGLPLLKIWWHWLIIGVIGLVGALLLNDSEYYTTIIGLLVPTIIHVYLFTLLFMLYGAKKSGSTVGYVAVVLALLVPLGMALINLEGVNYLFDDRLKEVYIQNNFHVTPVLFSKFIGLSDGTSFFFYEHLWLRFMMFISFIYCYHYLNWFSKTTVIQWHRLITGTKAIIIAVIWVINLSLFYYDFRLGFLVSLFFSFLHVILEFPLNMLSIKGLLNLDKR